MALSSTKDLSAIVLRFVRGVMTAPIDRIEIRHVHSGGDSAAVISLSGDRISGKGITPEGIALEIEQEILSDIQLFSGIQSYAILVYRPGERDFSSRKIVQLKGADKTSDQIEESEPANEKGVTSMTMRHLEARHADVQKREVLVAQQSEALIARLSSMVEKLADVFPRVLNAEQSLLDRQAERSLEIKRSEKQDKLIERGVEQLMMYGGPLLQKILPGPTGQALATDAMLINLLSSMTPDQVQAFMQTLRPEQQANFIELYKGLKARYEKVKLSNDGEANEENANPPNGATS